MTQRILENLAKHRIVFSEVYQKLVSAKPGDFMGSWLNNVRITGISQDPISRTLLVTFKGPFRIEKLIASSVRLDDPSVLYARLDLDSKGKPVSLEILPLE